MPSSFSLVTQNRECDDAGDVTTTVAIKAFKIERFHGLSFSNLKNVFLRFQIVNFVYQFYQKN